MKASSWKHQRNLGTLKSSPIHCWFFQDRVYVVLAVQELKRSTCVWLLGDGINSAYRCLAPPVYFNHQRKKDNFDVLQVAWIYEVHTFTLRLVRSMSLPGDFRHAGRVLKLQLSQLSTFSVDVYNIPTYSAKHAWGPCPDYTAIIRTYTDKIKANKLISWPA